MPRMIRDIPVVDLYEKWRGAFSETGIYAKSDLVYHSNRIYIAKRDLTASVATPDTAPDDWQEGFRVIFPENTVIPAKLTALNLLLEAGGKVPMAALAQAVQNAINANPANNAGAAAIDDFDAVAETANTEGRYDANTANHPQGTGGGSGYFWQKIDSEGAGNDPVRQFAMPDGSGASLHTRFKNGAVWTDWEEQQGANDSDFVRNNFRGEWAAGQNYAVGDVVYRIVDRRSSQYRCRVAITASTDAAVAEPAATGSNWDLIVKGTEVVSELPTANLEDGDVVFRSVNSWLAKNVSRILLSDELNGVPLIDSFATLDEAFGRLGRVNISTQVAPAGTVRGLIVNNNSRIEGLLLSFSGDVNERTGSSQFFVTDTGIYKRVITTLNPGVTDFTAMVWTQITGGGGGGTPYELPAALTAFRAALTDAGVINNNSAFGNNIIELENLSEGLRALIQNASGATGHTEPVQRATVVLKALTQASTSNAEEGWVIGGASAATANIGGENLHYHTKLSAAQAATTVQFDIPSTATHAVAYATRGNSHNLVPVPLGDLQGIALNNTRGYGESQYIPDDRNSIRVHRLQHHFRVTLSDRSEHLERLFIVEYTRNVDLHTLMGERGLQGFRGASTRVLEQTAADIAANRMRVENTPAPTDAVPNPAVSVQNIQLKQGPAGNDATEIPATPVPVYSAFHTVAHDPPGGGQSYVLNTDANFGRYIAPPQDGHATSISDNVWLPVPSGARLVMIRCGYEGGEPVNEPFVLPANFNGAIRGATRSASGHPIALRIENVAGTIEVGLRGNGHNLRLYEVYWADQTTLSAIRGLDGGSIVSLTYRAAEHDLLLIWRPAQTLTERNPATQRLEIPLPTSIGLDQDAVDARVRAISRVITGAVINSEGRITITRANGGADIILNISDAVEAAISGIVPEWARDDTTAIPPTKGALPPGGTTGQVIAKASDTDFDTAWITQTSGGGGGGSAPVALPDLVVHARTGSPSQHISLPANYTDYKFIEVVIQEGADFYRGVISTKDFARANDFDRWQLANTGDDYVWKNSPLVVSSVSPDTIRELVLTDIAGGSSGGGNPNMVRRVDGFASVLNGIESETVAFRITGNAVLGLPAGEYLLEAFEDDGTGNDTVQRATNFTTNEVFTRHNLSGEWSGSDTFTKISGFRWSENLLDGTEGREAISSAVGGQNIRALPEMNGAREVRVEAARVFNGIITYRDSVDIINIVNNTFAYRIYNSFVAINFTFPSATQIRLDNLISDNQIIGVYVYK